MATKRGPMKLTFEVETHKDKAGNYVAQVLLGGMVLWEDDGPISASQAVANVTSSFASLLAGAIERQNEWNMGEVDA